MDGYVTIKAQLDTKNFDKQIQEIEYELKQIDYELSHAKELKLDTRTISEYEKKAEQLNNKLVDLRKKQADLNKQNLSNAITGIEKMGKSVSGVIKKVIKWGLAIFGIRSAYLAVRSAMSILSNYNEQLATDIDYIKFALANTLKPVIDWVIKAVYTLLSYISAIVKSLFNINIFSGASADNFKKTNKEAQSLKKTLAGFDEMNVISDSTSGGAGGGATPSVDLSIPDENIQKNVEKMKKMATEITSFWEKDWEKYFLTQTGNWNAFIAGIGILLEGFYQVFKGIIDLIVGLGKWLVGIFTLNFDLISEGWKQMCDGLKEIFIGAFEIIFGALLTVLGLIKGVFLDILNWINKYLATPLINVFSNIWNGLLNGAKNAWNGVKSIFSTVSSFFKTTFTNAWTAVKNVFSTGGKIFDGIKDGIVDAFKTIVNSLIGGINKVISTPFNAINGMLNKIRNTDILGQKPFKGLWGQDPISIPKIPKLAMGGIVNMPGRGVMVGSAIAGEAGAEGVIPLTNSQQMELLGEAIGKYITINANITNTMNGRVISRELQKVQNSNDFAFNR